jgi:hypothetical protein
MSFTEQDSARSQSLDADLAALRAALRAVEAPAPDEAALRMQFRDAARQRAITRTAPRGGGSRRLPLAAAAAVVLAIGVGIGALALRRERPAEEPVARVVPGDATQPAVGAFQPLLDSPRLSPSASYSVVRVRIPLSAFAVVPGTMQEQSIEADLLVGEDGLARGIRFDEADAALVSVAGQSGQ